MSPTLALVAAGWVCVIVGIATRRNALFAIGVGVFAVVLVTEYAL